MHVWGLDTFAAGIAQYLIILFIKRHSKSDLMLFTSDVVLEIASKNKCVIKLLLPQAILLAVVKCNSFASYIVPFNSMRPKLLQCLQKLIIIKLFI